MAFKRVLPSSKVVLTALVLVVFLTIRLYSYSISDHTSLKSNKVTGINTRNTSKIRQLFNLFVHETIASNAQIQAEKQKKESKNQAEGCGSIKFAPKQGLFPITALSRVRKDMDETSNTTHR